MQGWKDEPMNPLRILFFLTISKIEWGTSPKCLDISANISPNRTDCRECSSHSKAKLSFRVMSIGNLISPRCFRTFKKLPSPLGWQCSVEIINILDAQTTFLLFFAYTLPIHRAIEVGYSRVLPFPPKRSPKLVNSIYYLSRQLKDGHEVWW